MLIHLVDATGDDPVKAWKIVKGELEAYGAGLKEKPQLLALNKGDLLGPELMADIAKSFARRKAGKPFLISGATGRRRSTRCSMQSCHCSAAICSASAKTESAEHAPALEAEKPWSPI